MAKPDYKPYPKAIQERCGIKVTWHYYDNEDDAKKCAEIAKHNGAIDRAAGYDHGYCMPGQIRKPVPGTNQYYPDLYEVCTC